MLEFIYNKIAGLFQSSNINIKVCRVKGMMHYFFFISHVFRHLE